MKTIRERIVDDTILEEDTQLEGTIIGSATVSDGVKLRLHGEIIGDVTLKKNSKVHIHGTVNGNVLNEGGYLEVFGIINGKINCLGGKTIIDSKALVFDRKE